MSIPTLSTHTESLDPRYIFGAVLLLPVLFIVSPMLFGLALVLMLAYVVYTVPEVGFYGMVLFAPMIGIVWTGEWINRTLGVSIMADTFTAPMVDVCTVFVLCVVGARMLVKHLSGESQTILLPGVWLYSLFLLSGALSLLHLHGAAISEGLKYMIRFPVFVYVGYIVLGMQLIRSRAILERALQIFVGVSIYAALQGALSLIINISSITGLYRAVPLSLFGLDLFNFAGDVRYGHILMAEHLTVAIPIVIYLAYHARGAMKRWYIAAGIFLISVCILTFSRAGWLTLFVQAAVFISVFRHQISWKKYKAYLPIALVLLIIPFAYMMQTLTSQTVASSNEARIVLTEIGWFHFLERPVFGQGAGQFTILLQDTNFFTTHFGDPVDAHSIVTKLMTEQGLVGLITFVLFIGWLLKEIFLRGQDEQYRSHARMAAVLGLFLVITPLFFQLFNTQYYAARMWMPIVFAISLIHLYRTEKSSMSMYISFLPKKKYTIISNIFNQR